MWTSDGDPAAPLLVVVGNCQAESLRLLLAGDDVRTVRLPAVHELVAADIDPLRRLLSETELLVTQPIGDDFRGLPVGSAQLVAALPASARAVLVPSVRYAGLHPHHLLVHPPGLENPDPPVMPYHDVRTAVSAAWLRAGLAEPEQPALTPSSVLAVAEASVAELRRREAAAGAVVVSDLLAHPTADTMRTINHPGNEVLAPLAARLRSALAMPERPPGVTRPLLNHLHAPLEPAVVEAHGLDVPARPAWTLDGAPVPTAVVRAAHLEWYAERPAMLDAALARSAVLRGQLGLVLPASVSSGPARP